MKNFKQQNLSRSSLIVSAILGLLTITSCSTEQLDETNELNATNQSLATPETGTIYTIENRNSGRIMEIANGSNSNEANLRQSGTEASPTETHRMFELFNTSDGFIRIRGVDSRKSLEVRDGSNSNGANVEQRSFGGETHQEWELIATGEGYYRIRNRDSRKSISVDGGSTNNGANIEIDAWNGNDRFQWRFIEVGSNNNDSGDDESDTPSNPPITGDFGLDPNLEPWENFDLSDWSLDSPAERPSDECRATRINEDEYDEIPGSPTRPYFFTHTDGGMRFVSPVGGATTNSSCNSGFPRTELREMLRAGNTDISTTGVNDNNWALGYQDPNPDHGGRNGVLSATLRINRVTTTGDGLHPGRTIIGQIHASDDEPARLYYRKCPDAEFGSIYLEHEIRDNDGDEAGDVTFNLLGSEQCNGNGPSNGIRLNELFSYEIINDDSDIIVNIYRGDKEELIASTTVDMLTVERNGVVGSGYDRPELDDGEEVGDEWMYFKAGAYTQNNTGDDDDTDIITFYRLSNTHDSN